MNRSELIQNWYDARYAWVKAKREEISLQREYEFTTAQLYVDYPAKMGHFQRLKEIVCSTLVQDLQIQLDEAHEMSLRCWIEVGRWQLELKLNPEVEALEANDAME